MFKLLQRLPPETAHNLVLWLIRDGTIRGWVIVEGWLLWQRLTKKRRAKSPP